MQAFNELTHLGQARRLRSHATGMLGHWGIHDASLRQLTEASNIVFRVDTADHHRFVLRMSAPKSAHTPATLLAASAWMRALHRDGTVGVPEPIPARDGEYIHTLSVPGVPGAWHCELFSWVPGAMLEDRLSPENVWRHGALAARLHEHAGRFVPPADARVRAYSSVFPYSDQRFPGAEPILVLGDGDATLLPPRRLDTFRAAHDLIHAEIQSLFDRQPPRVIHNDLHVWNVKLWRDRIFALDFEDLLLGCPIQDLATTLYYYRYREGYPTLLSAFREGYETVRRWPEERDGQLEVLIAGRGMLLANFVLASNDAAEREIAPGYLARAEKRMHAFLEQYG